jgi:hypothetical protein
MPLRGGRPASVSVEAYGRHRQGQRDVVLPTLLPRLY